MVRVIGQREVAREIHLDPVAFADGHRGQDVQELVEDLRRRLRGALCESLAHEVGARCVERTSGSRFGDGSQCADREGHSEDAEIVVIDLIPQPRIADLIEPLELIEADGISVGHEQAMVSHVYGAHYDFAANELGHPVFHGQMRSYLDFAEVIKSQYGLEGVELKDMVNGILKTVRLPSAQMDVFSFLLQIVADHLLSGDSSDDDKMRFRELLERSKFIQGLGSQIARLQVAPANVCYRAVHWYPPHA